MAFDLICLLGGFLGCSLHETYLLSCSFFKIYLYTYFAIDVKRDKATQAKGGLIEKRILGISHNFSFGDSDRYVC